MKRYVSRKFLLALLTLIAAGAANALRLPIDPIAADLVKWTLGLYFTGNIAATGATALAGALTRKAAA